MATVNERLAEQIATTTRRLGQLKARELLREMRATDRRRSSERRALARRRVELGDAILKAGCGDWDVMEIVGTLVDARERFGSSSTQRLGMRKKGEVACGTALGRQPQPGRTTALLETYAAEESRT